MPIAANTNCSPVHAHDCERCTYLGTTILYGKTFDFWTCDVVEWDGPTLICRWSSAGEDYVSATVDVARILNGNDPVYRYALSLYDQWKHYMEDMGYNDIRCPLCGDPTCGGWCG